MCASTFDVVILSKHLRCSQDLFFFNCGGTLSTSQLSYRLWMRAPRREALMSRTTPSSLLDKAGVTDGKHPCASRGLRLRRRSAVQMPTCLASASLLVSQTTGKTNIHHSVDGHRIGLHTPSSLLAHLPASFDAGASPSSRSGALCADSSPVELKNFTNSPSVARLS